MTTNSSSCAHEPNSTQLNLVADAMHKNVRDGNNQQIKWDKKTVSMCLKGAVQDAQSCFWEQLSDKAIEI